MEGYIHPDIYLRRSGPKHRWKSRKRSGRLHNRALLAAALLAKRGRRESDGDQPAEHKFGSAEHERAVVLFLHWIRREQLAGGRVRSIESAQFRAAGAALHVFAGALELEELAAPSGPSSALSNSSSSFSPCSFICQICTSD